MENESTNQFWVESYLDGLQVHEWSKSYKHRDALVDFFISQFDKL
jgi:hypothetical protein